MNIMAGAALYGRLTPAKPQECKRQTKPTVDKCGCLCSPGGRGKFWDALEWRVCKSWKDSGQVITDWEVEPAAAFNNGEDCCDAWAGVFAADMDPVGAAQGDGTHRILGEIVAQFQLRIVEEACQSRPDRKCVAASLARSALGQHRLAHGQDVSTDPGRERSLSPVGQHADAA